MNSSTTSPPKNENTKSFNDFDLNIFKQENIDNNDNDKCESIDNCISIQKLSVALKYYELMDIINNISHRDAFTNFIIEIYHKFLDDFTHLVNHHSNHLNDIYIHLINTNKFNECKMANCVYTARHYHHRRDVDKDGNVDKNVLDPEVSFFAETMDSLHFYLFHLFECGLRSIITEDGVVDDDDDEMKQEDEFYDAEFAKISRRISERQYMTKSFDRFTKSKNNKFCLNTDNNWNNNNNIDINGDETYLDEIFKRLLKDGINKNIVYKLSKYLLKEEFDTDCMDQDIDDDNNTNDNDGNISNHINNKQTIEKIKNYIKTSKCMKIYIVFSPFNIYYT